MQQVMKSGRLTEETKEKKNRCERVRVYLCDEHTGNAFRIVPFGVGGSEQLLTFPLLEAVQER